MKFLKKFHMLVLKQEHNISIKRLKLYKTAPQVAIKKINNEKKKTPKTSC